MDYTKNIMVGSFRGILGIHPIKAFSGDLLLWFGHKIKFSFNYHYLFLLKKQNQYAQNWRLECQLGASILYQDQC